MANIIRRSDISEEDVFKNIRDSATSTIKVLDGMNQELNETSTILKKEIQTAKFIDVKAINNFTDATKKATAAKEKAVKIDEQRAKAVKIQRDAEIHLEKIRREKLKTEREEIRNKAALSREAERLERQTRKQVKVLEEERNEYKKLVKQTRDYKSESKRLAANLIKLEQSGRKNTKEFRHLSEEYRRVTKAAQNGDRALKKIDATVGDNFRNVGNYTQAISKLRANLGQLGLAFGGFQLLRGAGETVAEFDQSIRDLVAITGASGDDLDFFKQKAIDLGTEVTGGAAAVIDAYKLIGSAKPELLQNAAALNEVTEAAITLSQASGLDLPDAATRLTDAMNQFGADADQAARFIDVLANGSLFGAAAIPQVTDAMLKFGAVAKQSNITVEESTALIEALAEKGLKGAEAGTALRNIMLKLSAPDALPKEAQVRLEQLGIAFEDINDTSKPFSERLEALKPLLKDQTALIKVFGQENAVAATNLIEMTDEVEELTEKMEKQNTATEQAEERTDTLAFAFNKLKEEWNKLVLEFTEGSGATSFLKDTLLFIANNLRTILLVIGKAVVAWGIYKTAVLSTRAAHFVLSGGIKDTIKGMISQVKSLKDVGKASKNAGTAIKQTGNVMKAVPWVAVIGFALELASAWYDVASGAKAAREAQEEVEKIEEKAEKRRTDRSQARSERLQKQLAENERLFRKEEITEEKLRQLNEEAIAAERERAKGDRKSVNDRAKTLQEELDFLQRWTKRWNGQILSAGGQTWEALAKRMKNLGFKGLAEDMRGGSVSANEFNKMVTITKGKIGSAWESWRVYNDEIENYTEQLEEAKVQTFETNKNQEEFAKSTGVVGKKIRRVNTDFSDMIDRMTELNKLYREQIDLQNDLNQIEFEAKISIVEDDIEAELERQRSSAQATGEIQVDALEELIDKKAKLQRQAVIDQAEFEQAEAARDFEQRFNTLERELEKERQKLLSQKELTEDEIAKIEAGYRREREDLDALRIEQQKNLDLELEKIHRESAEELKEIDRDVAEEKNNVNDELIQEQINYANRQKEVAEEGAKGVTDAEREAAQRRKEIAQALTDFLIEKSEERLRQAEKELSNAQNAQKRLEELADNGNIKAEQSLAEQNRIIAEAEKKKIEEQRNQQRLELINAGLQTYNSKVEAGSENPLGETIRDIALLQQFLSTIPAFYEGTDTTVSDALGAPQLSGRDGYVVRVDGQEKILNPSLSQMTGNMSTSEIAQVSQDYLNGKLINRGEGAVQIADAWNTSQVIRKLDSLEQTIKDKPETAYNFEELSERLFAILKTEKRGNSLIHNRFRQDV